MMLGVVGCWAAKRAALPRLPAPYAAVLSVITAAGLVAFHWFDPLVRSSVRGVGGAIWRNII